jgi:predicted Zn-dependent protease
VRAAYARILVDNKQLDEARKQFLLLLKDQPDNIATLYALGVMAMQSNDLPEAEKYFALRRRAGSIRTTSAIPSKALLILSQIAEQRNDLDAAYNWLDKIDGSDEKVYLAARMKMAVLLARQGNVDQRAPCWPN